MNKLFLIFLALIPLSNGLLLAQNADAYIEAHKLLAVEQHKKHGIPASVTLAQAILESASGTSELALKANNHFGIKCANNRLPPYTCYDKASKENEKDGTEIVVVSCFCQFPTVEEGYEGHSRFLKAAHYQSCFECGDDMECFVKELVKNGYATDPSYVTKILKPTGQYNLVQFDKYDEALLAISESNDLARYEDEEIQQALLANQENEIAQIEAEIARKKAELAAAEAALTKKLQEYNMTIADARGRGVSALSKADLAIYNQLSFEMDRLVPEIRQKGYLLEENTFLVNGIQVATARAKDFAAKVAARYSITLEQLRQYNDLLPNQEVQPGERVFLAPKADKWNGPEKTHTVKEGEDWRAVAQFYGIKMAALRKLNRKVEDQLKKGNVLKIR